MLCDQCEQGSTINTGEQLPGDLPPEVYAQLRLIARRQLRRGSSNTFQPTELVHDFYLKLQSSHSDVPVDRTHFFALSARMIRQIICDHARKKSAEKRDGGLVCVDITLSGLKDELSAPIIDILEIDRALNDLEAMDQTSAKVVELRLFSGLTAEEISTELGISSATIQRKWRIGKSWLQDRLGAAP